MNIIRPTAPGVASDRASSPTRSGNRPPAGLLSGPNRRRPLLPIALVGSGSGGQGASPVRVSHAGGHCHALPRGRPPDRRPTARAAPPLRGPEPPVWRRPVGRYGVGRLPYVGVAVIGS